MTENKYLQDFFNKKYSDSIGDSNFYIAFEDCGFHISKDASSDPITHQYSENVLAEQLSIDCDYIVPVCDTVPGHSFSTISGYMQMLQATIQFNDAKFTSNAEDMLTLFGNAKNQFNKQFQPAVSSIDPRSHYYPSNLNPGNFLDNADVWTPYSESWSFPSTSTGTGTPPAGIWKIRPDLLKAIHEFKNFPTRTFEDKPADGINVRREPLAHAALVNEVANTTAATPHAAFATTAPAASAMHTSTMMSASTMAAARPAISSTAVMKPDAEIATGTTDGTKTLPSHFLINKDILAQRFVLSKDPGEQDNKPVTTSSVDIAFKYCIVNIDRPWLYKSIFDLNQMWYCTSLTEGFFSTGDASQNNNGKLPSLPVSMILIKDLSISAVFNAGDWQNAKNAVALDSLNISEADFKDLGDNKHVIESAGVQIIGWICEYLPKFPICTDPHQPTA